MVLRFWKAEESITARGNLSDVHVAELVHLIAQGRKTGALAMNSRDDEALLYFRKGTLVDARTGQDLGLDALSQIVGWSSGTFEFRSNATTSDMTIEMDLHDALTEAARIHNEKTQRAQEEAWRRNEDDLLLAVETPQLPVEDEQSITPVAGQHFTAAAWRQQGSDLVQSSPQGDEQVQEAHETHAEQIAEAEPVLVVVAEPMQLAEEEPVCVAVAEPELIVVEEPIQAVEEEPVCVAVAAPELVAVEAPMQAVEEEPAPVAEAASASCEQAIGAADIPAASTLDADTCAQIGQWIEKSPFLRHVSLLNAEGGVIGEAHARGVSPNGTYKLSQHMREFVREYPRTELRRVVIEDEAGTVVMANLPQQRLLIAVADDSVSLGSVCVTLNKMSVSLGA
jgi:hypothetical protein